MFIKIEKSWSEDPKYRTSFDRIFYKLENNPEFITENVDKEDNKEEYWINK